MIYNMRGFFCRCIIFAAALIFLIEGIKFLLLKAVQTYPYAYSVSQDNSLVKQKGGVLLDNLPSDNLLLLGASELNTTDIPSNPVNLLSDDRAGFTVNIVGRGSCQAIVHASILAATKDLEGKKIAFILSPQSFVPQGIAPDMYFANFSEQQFCRILLNQKLPDDIKSRFKSRLTQLAEQYAGQGDGQFDTYEFIASSQVAEWISLPYLWLKNELLALKDAFEAWQILREAPPVQQDKEPIDWADERETLLQQAPTETDNNEFQFLNDYYNVNIKRKLQTFKDADVDLSYMVSPEYEDFKLLLDVCKSRGIRPLIISTPLNGPWCDYTGFDKQERDAYYAKVKELAAQYNVEFYDLSSYEYEPYFMCDAIHIGWIGWLMVDERITEFYNENIGYH